MLQILRGDFQWVFVAFLLTSIGAFACFQFTIEQFPWQVLIRHMTHMPCLSQLGSLEHCLYALQVCSLENFCIWNLVLPFNVEKLPEAPHVEGVQLLCMATGACPSLTSIQQ